MTLNTKKEIKEVIISTLIHILKRERIQIGKNIFKFQSMIHNKTTECLKMRQCIIFLHEKKCSLFLIDNQNFLLFRIFRCHFRRFGFLFLMFRFYFRFFQGRKYYNLPKKIKIFNICIGCQCLSMASAVPIFHSSYIKKNFFGILL